MRNALYARRGQGMRNGRRQVLQNDPPSNAGKGREQRRALVAHAAANIYKQRLGILALRGDILAGHNVKPGLLADALRLHPELEVPRETRLSKCPPVRWEIRMVGYLEGGLLLVGGVCVRRVCEK